LAEYKHPKERIMQKPTTMSPGRLR